MFKPGDQVTWLHQPRGGYGYVIPVNGEVVRETNYGPVVIRVKTKSGIQVDRRVKPENLRLKG